MSTNRTTSVLTLLVAAAETQDLRETALAAQMPAPLGGDAALARLRAACPIVCAIPLDDAGLDVACGWCAFSAADLAIDGPVALTLAPSREVALARVARGETCVVRT